MLAKLSPCSICSQNLDGCTIARGREMRTIVRMLGFFIKFSRSLEISLIVPFVKKINEVCISIH